MEELAVAEVPTAVEEPAAVKELVTLLVEGPAVAREPAVADSAASAAGAIDLLDLKWIEYVERRSATFSVPRSSQDSRAN